MSFLSKDLTDTSIGWLIFAMILPSTAIWAGARGTANGSVNVRGAEVHGTPALCFSAGYILFGLGCFAFPRPSRISKGAVSSLNVYRMLAGAGLVVAGAVMVIDF